MADRNGAVSRSSSKRSSASSSTNTCDALISAKKAKRQVTLTTFEKWQRNLDAQHQTLTWLKCDKDAKDKNLVSLLWCSACREFKEKICSRKNYSHAWVSGSTNQRTSNILDHANCDQHKAAMSYLRAAQAKASNHYYITYNDNETVYLIKLLISERKLYTVLDLVRPLIEVI